MNVEFAGDGIWKISQDWFSGEADITLQEKGGFEIEISWALENGDSLSVRGTITHDKPEGFDSARRRYLAARRAKR